MWLSEYSDQAIEVQFLTGTRDFFTSSQGQTGSGAHPASCTLCTSSCIPKGDANWSPPSIAEVKSGGAITLLSICCHNMVLNQLSTGIT